MVKSKKEKKIKQTNSLKEFQKRQRTTKQIQRIFTTRREKTLRRILESKGASLSSKTRARRLLGI